MIEIETDVPVLRQISVRAVMEYLLHAGPASRAAMAKATRLSKQTMSEVILILEERGGFALVGSNQVRSGAPP